MRLRFIGLLIVNVSLAACGGGGGGGGALNPFADLAGSPDLASLPADAATAGDFAGPDLALPPCSDGKKDGDETDVDCGGARCPKCADGKVCNMATDCASGICANTACRPRPTCGDNVKNQDETDVDCGGLMCAKCPDGKACGANADCV